MQWSRVLRRFSPLPQKVRFNSFTVPDFITMLADIFLICRRPRPSWESVVLRLTCGLHATIR